MTRAWCGVRRDPLEALAAHAGLLGLSRTPKMSFDHEKAQALRMLKGIEEGSMSPADSFTLLDEADPTLVYLVFKWIRKRYRDHEAAEGVIGRLVNITQRYRSITRKAKEGERDPVVDWFEGTYDYKELTAEEFVDVIVEKLEG